MISNLQIYAAAKLWITFIMSDTPAAPTLAQKFAYDLQRDQHRKQLQKLTGKCKDWPYLFEQILIQKLLQDPRAFALHIDAGTCKTLESAIIELEHKLKKYFPNDDSIINDSSFFPTFKNEVRFLENDTLLVNGVYVKAQEVLSRKVTSIQEETLLSSNKKYSFIGLKFFNPAIKNVSTGALYHHELNTMQFMF